ncbi:MAG: molybdopterin-guanine dinucleotide biosynthesis protein B [Chloroflexi bacterium]|nr:molybdopterin-guanine dinucleotide biosynthesis protein B [Chloroflexota bacterium]MBL7061558.1 molybdopterin-guanine dinucleotide biosynthesis protein B [Dehalococcoidia bacterium]
MPPIVSIVGESKSGKTTLIEALISELKSRGHRIATIKHSVHRLNFDKPDKDSWRHIQAGSNATAIVSPDQVVLIKPVTQEPDLNEIARLFSEDYDIILAEGFKQSNTPKLEVHRKAAGPPLSRINNLMAIATDEPLETTTRQFPLHDIKSIADFLENSFIKPK